jgi:hypothetical protein
MDFTLMLRDGTVRAAAESVERGGVRRARGSGRAPRPPYGGDEAP